MYNVKNLMYFTLHLYLLGWSHITFISHRNVFKTGRRNKVSSPKLMIHKICWNKIMGIHSRLEGSFSGGL